MTQNEEFWYERGYTRGHENGYSEGQGEAAESTRRSYNLGYDAGYTMGVRVPTLHAQQPEEADLAPTPHQRCVDYDEGYAAGREQLVVDIKEPYEGDSGDETDKADGVAEMEDADLRDLPLFEVLYDFLRLELYFSLIDADRISLRLVRETLEKFTD